MSRLKSKITFFYLFYGESRRYRGHERVHGRTALRKDLCSLYQYPPPASTTTRLRGSTDPADTSSSSSRHFHLLPPPTSTHHANYNFSLAPLQSPRSALDMVPSSFPASESSPPSPPLLPPAFAAVLGCRSQGRTQIGGPNVPLEFPRLLMQCCKCKPAT